MGDLGNSARRFLPVLSAILYIFLTCSHAGAQPREAGPVPAEERLGLDSIFGPGMVLQRDMPISIWGHSAPHELVTVALDSQQMEVRTDDAGQWSINFRSRPAGGPYLLEARSLTFHDQYPDIMIGEVWLCAGQSNMEFRLSKSDLYNENLAPDNNLRFLDVARRYDAEPSTHLMTLAPWTYSTPANAAGFSAVCHGFGQSLRANLNVPVGLINASWGGTKIEAFIDKETLQANRMFTSPLPSDPPRQGAGHVFNGMIAPLSPFTVRGVLWYQGESNTHEPEGYGGKLAAWARSWRDTFRQALPLIIVQLPKYNPEPRDPPGNWAALREEQRKFVLNDTNSELVVLVDQGAANELHPSDKRVVAERAAAVTLSRVYNFNIPAHGPTPLEAHRIENQLIVEYANMEGLEEQNGEFLSGFELCNQSCVSVPGRINGNTIVIRHPSIREMTDVRYNWSDVPETSFYNDAGFPAVPFEMPISVR